MQKVISIAIIGILFSGCSVFRGERKSTPAREYTGELSVTDVIESNLTNFDFIIQKAEIQYIDEGTEVNLIASLKHKADNKYLVSLRTKSGIEISRIFISEDTLLINDRINKKLFYGSPGYLEEKYGISFLALPLMFGDIIISNPVQETVICKDGKGEIKTKINTRNVSYLLNCTYRKVTNIKIENENKENHIEISLAEFQNMGANIYPGVIELTENVENSKVRIEIRKIEFNSVDNMNFLPGANYEKVLIK